ncbi:NAD-dependent epimerase/dehydratase family protein [Alphaproteobacteria bacterium]|nr:NAD-dependent epimerase/dehydratase family protein [Alphaproteobacteria bacterium]
MIFLTGASGFIGSQFLRIVMRRGCQVKVLSRDPGRWATNTSVAVYEGDLSREINWPRALMGVSVIVHMAAEIRDKNAMQSVNFDGPLRLLNAAIDAGVHRWVQLSSVGAYGAVQDGMVDEHWDDCPVGLYEKTKSDFDLALIEASKSSHLEVCIVRPSNVYGPGMRNQSIQQMLNAIQKNLFAFVGPEGASANYVHVQDVVKALDLCVKHPQAANQTYIVSAWATIEEMASGLAIGVGLNPPSRRVPLRVATLLAKAVQWWSRWPLTLSRVQAMSVRSRYSAEKIEKELGWKLTVPVKEGMREFARDLR